MKTTLELPDPLMRKVKVRAAETDRKLKDVMAELIARGLDEETFESKGQRNDPSRYLGAWPRYKSQKEVTAWVRELRKDRDEA